METDPQVYMEIGQLKGRLGALEATVADKMDAVLKRMDDLAEAFAEMKSSRTSEAGMVKGGWFVITTVAAILLAALTLMFNTVSTFFSPH